MTAFLLEIILVGLSGEELIPVSFSWAIFRVTYRKLHFWVSDFIAITITILEKTRIQPETFHLENGYV